MAWNSGFKFGMPRSNCFLLKFLEELTFHYIDSKSPKQASWVGLNEIPFYYLQSLLIFGGNNSKSWLTNVDQFTPSDSNWGQRSQMPEPRGYGAAASAGESVYLMGGGTGKKWYNSVLRYDVHEEAWFAVYLLPFFHSLVHQAWEVSSQWCHPISLIHLTM